MIDRIAPGVAAIDIGAQKYFVAVAQAPVQSFDTFTADLERLAQYLREHQVVRVAMEATGVYWIALHDYLDRHGFEVTVFNGAMAKNMPGKKTDVADCQWHAMLHSHGLLTPCFIPPCFIPPCFIPPCFIPPPRIRELRAYYRLRETHLEAAAREVQHLQKALDLMNVRLHQVISQIQGASGLRVIEAILQGERNPHHLAQLCDGRILKTKQEQVIKSLQGTWEPHHLFALRQAPCASCLAPGALRQLPCARRWKAIARLSL